MKHRVLAPKLLIQRAIFYRGAHICAPPVQIGLKKENVTIFFLILCWQYKVASCLASVIEILWRIQRLSDTGIPAWAPKLGAQIKGELMQNKISLLIISSTQIRQPVLRHLSKTLQNVELKTLCMLGFAAQVCLNVSQCIVCINNSNISVALVCPN